MEVFRPADQAELRLVFEVFFQNELLENPSLSLPDTIPPYLNHVLQTGKLYVAEKDGKVLAFAGAITRGNISFLTDLFVLPTRQSGQLGKSLLHAVLPRDQKIHCTLSSSDPRALALYIRSGMQPQWPHFALRLDTSNHIWTLAPDMAIIEADASDPALVRWDTQACGRMRPAEHQFWVREEGAVPLWFRRHGQIVGYAYVRFDAEVPAGLQSCKLGPIGVSSPEDATACVLAAVHWALQRANVLHIDVPGPHPCLAILLEGGFHISSFDTFASSSLTPFFDARCYIASGGDLF
jgi:hypothetical protein